MGVLRVSHWCVGVITRPDWTLETPRLHMRASSSHARPFVRARFRFFDICNLSKILSIIILTFSHIAHILITNSSYPRKVTIRKKILIAQCTYRITKQFKGNIINISVYNNYPTLYNLLI